MTRFFVTLLAFFAAQPAWAQTSDYAAFGAFLEAFRKESGTPALSALIVRDGEIAWETYLGTYDDEGERPTRAETTYKIASVTKPIAATAILEESSKAGLSLNTRMDRDDEWSELCEFFVSSTPIPFMAGGKDRMGNPIAPMDCSKPTSIADMLDMRANGAEFVYNPIAFARLDRAILGGRGRALRDIVRERVVDPAGMADTALGWRDPQGGAALRHLAEPFHVIEGRAVKQVLPDDDFRAAAGIIANPRAIAAFDIAFDRGDFGDVGELTRLPIGPLGDYRRGWFLEDWNGTRLMWHSGWNEKKYSALYLKVPAKRLTLIVLANTEAVWWSNSLVKAEVVQSPIAARFLETFVQ
ncbi:MAG: serine hydrolase domain-containing protein [Erythrobacter sp.]|uniref:serine hydrolase domain-containing protein n=1 Tax=Erythrobacter sp. TaxID=1042 RepID=UPI002616B420|nr:serine hydrolase domain-containing protein [Erythrobacter sp.]MDJ0977425.1 serine hydrolase domain-containing protein [Erythrobacter sp.]